MTLGVFTLLYDTSYLPGVIVLGISLKRLLEVQPRNINIGVLIDKSKFNSIQLSLIESFYDDVIDVCPIQSKLSQKLYEELGRPELDKTFTKVVLWSLTNYDRILYLDADTLPLIPKGNDDGSVIDLLSIEFPKNKILAAPDSGFPDIFNSGVFVLKPDLEDFNRLYDLSQLQHSGISFDGADQGLLNQYFNTEPDWVNSLISKGLISSFSDEDTKWIKIPFLYNVTPSAQYEYLPAYNYFSKWKGEQPNELAGHKNDLPIDGVESSKETSNRYFTSALKFTNTKSNIKLMHFIGPYKPWTAHASSGIYDAWWKIWRSYFGSRSIESVIASGFNQGTHGLQDNELRRLLDPLTYANAPEVGTSIDAAWDGSKGPLNSEIQDNETILSSSTFKEELKNFKNVWDQESDNSVTVSHEGTVSNATSQLPYNAIPPERVFNDHFNILSHEAESIPSNRPPITNEEVMDVEDVSEALTTITLEKSIDTSEPETTTETDIKKLFPWEYRSDSIAPERSFD